MTRREFKPKIKVAAFKRSGGVCECGCGQPLRPGHIQYDHVIPDAMGGEPTLENCLAVTDTCHGAKTAKIDIPAIAKAKRREARHVGAKAPPRVKIASAGFEKKEKPSKIPPYTNERRYADEHG